MGFVGVAWYALFAGRVRGVDSLQWDLVADRREGGNQGRKVIGSGYVLTVGSTESRRRGRPYIPQEDRIEG